MSYKLVAYILFILVVAYVTIRVGWIFYKNGEVYLKRMLPDDHHLVQSINKMLLIGYYLLNLGYAAVSIVQWEPVVVLTDVFHAVATYSGQIILLLGLMHYFNMLWILFYARYKDKQERIRKALSGDQDFVKASSD